MDLTHTNPAIYTAATYLVTPNYNTTDFYGGKARYLTRYNSLRPFTLPLVNDTGFSRKNAGIRSNLYNLGNFGISGLYTPGKSGKPGFQTLANSGVSGFHTIPKTYADHAAMKWNHDPYAYTRKLQCNPTLPYR